MRNKRLVVTLVAAGALATAAFADVQNIRLSGDIRIRGYELINAGDNHTDENFISQRTRVLIEADLEDHVLVVATIKAEGLWGSYDESFEASSGAGVLPFGLSRINRGWDLGLTEAYVQLNEMFYSPVTLKLGRQHLHYGRGLILSSFEQEYNYDAARLVVDYYPLVIDLVYARLAEDATFGVPFSKAYETDMIFVNGRYEFGDSILKNVEAYFGYQIVSGFPLYEPPSPLIIGLRSDLSINENLNLWVEGAYEFGSGAGETEAGLSAFLVNAGGRFTLADAQWSPAFNANYVYASGGSGSSGDNFFPWFDYVDGYFGYLFSPALVNIHIFNVGASIKPCENTTLSLQAYYYLKADRAGGASSNLSVDFGGHGGFSPPGYGTDIGLEIDAIVGYDYSKDVRAQLVYGVFIPGSDMYWTDGITFARFSRVAHEIRGEINVRF